MSASAPVPILEARNVAVHFGGLVAIAEMSFAVPEGRIVSLIGPNGAGKTTAFNVITGFLRPTSGDVLYRGNSLIGLKSDQIAARGVVRTFQKTALFAGCTAFDNILIGLHRRGRAGIAASLLRLPAMRREEAELREEAGRILAFIGLERRSRDFGGSLAYGEQRLLEVGVALAARPKLLLLDEPAAGLNPTETEAFMAMVERIRALGITILLVEHDMRLVMAISDTVIVLNYGRIIAEGPPSEIQRHPEVITAYLGHGVKRAQA
jgi:branched-chain amino acid transport system ATP-binding protein